MIALPWTNESAPAAVLEINRQCNIACRGCYRKLDGSFEPLERVLAELRDIRRVRKVQTISIAGGETSLHPQLEDIVAAVHRQRLRVVLFTNGLLADDAFLRRMKAAGLDVVLFHVDEGQSRPDLPARPSLEQLNALRADLAARAAAHGLDAGLSVTIYPEHADRVPALVEFIIRSPHIDFLFATHFYEPRLLLAEARAGGRPGCPPARATSNAGVRADLARVLGLEPFAYQPTSWRPAGGEPAMSWLTYLVPVVRANGSQRWLRLRSGWADTALLRLSRLLAGRYLFYCPPRGGAVLAQALANAVGRGAAREVLGLLAAWRRGARLVSKRLLFDNGPVATDQGTIACGRYCPVASPRDGKVCRVCMGDMEDVPWHRA